MKSHPHHILRSTYTWICFWTLSCFVVCLLIPEPTPQYFNHCTFTVCLVSAPYFLRHTPLGLHDLTLVYSSLYLSTYSSVSLTGSSFSIHPLNISVFRTPAHPHSMCPPWVIVFTPTLMTLEYISVLYGVPKYLLTVQWNSKLNLSKTELIFSSIPHTNKPGLPLVFPPSLNGTTDHIVAKLKKPACLLGSLYPISSSWNQLPSHAHWTS